MKTCPICNTCFEGRKDKVYCSKRCKKKIEKKRYMEKKGIDIRLRYVYGIDLEEYNRMFEEQNGCCAICRTHQLELDKKLVVDHCHKTGNVRGLLCHHCNVGIGFLKDDKDIILSAYQYL